MDIPLPWTCHEDYVWNYEWDSSLAHIDAAIDIGVGSIRNYLDKLMVEGFLEGLKSDPKISTEGLRLLHDFWPEEFSFTEQGRFVQSDDVPFWTTVSIRSSIEGLSVGQPTLIAGFRLSNMDNHLDNSVQVHPLKEVDTEQPGHRSGWNEITPHLKLTFSKFQWPRSTVHGPLN